MKPPVAPRNDPLALLRAQTPARVALGHTGAGLPTAPMLAFQLDHARARDAVHEPLDTQGLAAQLAPARIIQIQSQAPDRTTYLQRPDLGRRVAPGCLSTLCGGPFDVAFILADGLSARAVQRHSSHVVRLIIDALPDWNIAPLVIATQARVALGDEVGAQLNAALAVVLIGERPGLSASDSLGLYLTAKPALGRRDHERNCISNIRPPQGLTYAEAAARAVWLLRAARRGGHSGVLLKDESALTGSLTSQNKT